MVRSFYDSEVDARGKKEGIIEGILEFLQELGEVPSNITKHINKNVIYYLQKNYKTFKYTHEML